MPQRVDLIGQKLSRPRISLGLLLLALCVPAALRAGMVEPQFREIYPAGARQGTTVEVELAGSNLNEEEPTRLFFSHPGIKAELIPPGEKDKGKPRRFKVTVAPDVPVGDYDVRVVCNYGITNPRFFCVSDSEEMYEKEPDNNKAEATRVNINTIVNGRIERAEDVDWFVFSAKAGQRILIDCRAWRIDSHLDGCMWLFDSNGKRLAMSQDEDLIDEKRDPFIDFDVPADGDYLLKFADFTYDGTLNTSGNQSGYTFFYRIAIGTFPHVDYILPSGAAPGSTTPITFYGRNLPGGEKTNLKINGRPLEKVVRQIAVPNDPQTLTELHCNRLVRPAAATLDGMEVRLKGEAGTSNAKLLLYDALPNVMETEPNNSREQAQRLTVPCAVNGQFMPGQADYYVFSAKKGEKLTLDIISYRLSSPADADLEILKLDGTLLESPKDGLINIGETRFTTNSIDVYPTVFNVPEDGDYLLRAQHQFRALGGGPQYVYRLRIQRDPAPDFRIFCVPVTVYSNAFISSHRVQQGGRDRYDILIWREYGFNEPITIEARNLPAGVTADPIVAGPNIYCVPLVLSAAAAAPISEGEIQVIGTATVKGQTLVRKARAGTMTWYSYGPPGNSRMAQNIVTAVRGTVPFTLTASPIEITVQEGEPFNLNLKLSRRADMPNAVQLDGGAYEAIVDSDPVFKGHWLKIPVTNIDSGQTDAKLSIKTDGVPAGPYTFIVNGQGQVPFNGQNYRQVFPANTVKVTILPKK